ncbi:helix-turn-helix transcriptional regulator [Lysinibacillus sp. NPDC097231]|uniref:helix-turn-helix transcriptional regulator n=1 Tax=Lysinibacillus sp. NPDC097231 TaxID=3364142 RepID=UPI00380C58A4
MENIIKEARKAKKMSQEDLAKVCGVSRQTINAIENNKYDPSLALAFQLAFCLGVSVDQLFQYTGKGNEIE